MILYTTMPLDMVFQGLEDLSPSYVEVELKGKKVIVEQTGLNQGKVVRLLSTDPQDYLNPALQPGMVIDFAAARSQ